MKKLIYIIGILLVVVLLTPWIMGFYFKQEYLHLITALNQTNQIKINILEYRMGWFSSHMKSSTELPVSKNTPVELILDEDITHGPIIYDRATHRFVLGLGMVKSHLHLPESFESLIRGSQKSQGILQITSIITFNQNCLIQMSMPVINSPLPMGGKISWDGLSGTSLIHTNHSRVSAIRSELTIGALSAATDIPQNAQLSIQPISLTSDAMINSIGLWTGTFKLAVPHFSLIYSGKNINLINLNINTKNTITDNIFYNSTKQLSIQKLEIPGNVISMISPATLDISMNNFNAKGMVELYAYLKNNRDTYMVDKQKFNSQSLALLTKIFLPTSMVASNIFINTSLGAITATTKAFFTTNTPAFTSSEDIIKNINLQINIRIATTLANRLIDYYYQTYDLQPLSTPRAAMNAPVQQATVEMFNDKIAALMKEGKLSLPLSLQVMTLSNQSLTLDQFNAGLIKLNISPTLTAQIAQIYAEVLTHPTTQPPTPPPVILPSDKAKIFITEWLKQGYLIQDNNDYVISITRQNGEVMINKKNISLEIPLTHPVSPAISGG
jgi:hypothetical protein